MIRQLFAGLLLSIAFLQCAPDEEAGEDAPLVVLLTCETQSSSKSDAPPSGVFLLVKEQKVKVAEITACQTFEPAEYSAYNIPDSALTACGGSAYLYVIREEKILKVFQSQQEEGFQYEEVFSLKLKR